MGGGRADDPASRGAVVGSPLVGRSARFRHADRRSGPAQRGVYCPPPPLIMGIAARTALVAPAETTPGDVKAGALAIRVANKRCHSAGSASPAARRRSMSAVGPPAISRNAFPTTGAPVLYGAARWPSSAPASIPPVTRR